jgi:hypothetical protein
LLSFDDAVKPWHDLYTLVGTASATLIGLLFVAASVGAGVYTKDRLPALRAFLSPSVVHFTSVLAACLVAMVPTRSWLLAGVLVGAVGVFGLTYSGLVWRSIWRHGMHRSIDLEDRFYYAALPALGHAATLGAALDLLLQAPAGCGVLALAMGLLLLAGIRNAWDITVWTVTRDRG